jgi:hypothetical protein
MRAVAKVCAAVAVGPLGLGLLGTTGSVAAASPDVSRELVMAISVSPAYSRTGLVVVQSTGLYCSNCGHLWVSRDRGVSWQLQPATGWAYTAPTVAVGPGGEEDLLASSPKGWQISRDLGATWQTMTQAGSATAMPSYPSDRAVAVAGGGQGDYLVTDASAQTVTGSGGLYVDADFAMPSAGNPLLVSEDKQTGRVVIERCTAALTCSGPALLGSGAGMGGTNLAFSPRYGQDGVVFADVQTVGLFKSTDDGTTFSPLPLTVPGAHMTTYPALVLAPGYGDAGNRTAYAAVFAQMPVPSGGGPPTYSGGVYRSGDGGASWINLGGPLTAGATSVAVAPDGRLFAGYWTAGKVAGLLCSLDGGKTWAATCGGAQVTAESRSRSGSGTAPTRSPAPGSARSGLPGPAGVAAASTAGPGLAGTGARLSAAGTAGGDRSIGGRALLGAVCACLAVGFVALALWRRRQKGGPSTRAGA